MLVIKALPNLIKFTYVKSGLFTHLIIIISVSGINYYTILNMRIRSPSHLVVGPSSSDCLILVSEGIVKKTRVERVLIVKHKD